jgi:hypothetical protein
LKLGASEALNWPKGTNNYSNSLSVKFDCHQCAHRMQKEWSSQCLLRIIFYRKQDYFRESLFQAKLAALIKILYLPLWSEKKNHLHEDFANEQISVMGNLLIEVLYS